MDPAPVLLAGVAGVVINLLAARLLQRPSDHRHDLNRRAAAVHLLSDAALTATVLLSAALTALTAWPWLDGVAAVAVGAVVAANGLLLLWRSLVLALDAVPAQVDAAAVETLLAQLPGVQRVRELRIWGVSTARTALCAHLELSSAAALASQADLLRSARAGLRELGIDSCTLELELAP